MRRRAVPSRTELLSAIAMVVLAGATIVQLLNIRSQLRESGGAAPELDVSARVISDLRRTGGAGLLKASPHAIALRVPFAVGVVCGSDGPDTYVVMVSAYPGALDEPARVRFGWRAAATLHTVEASVERDPRAARSCADAGIEAPPGAVFARVSAGTNEFARGAAALLFDEVRYEFRASETDPGARALWRTAVVSGRAEELSAAPADQAGFRFYVEGSAAPTARVPAALERVRGIELHLATPGESGFAVVPAAVFLRDRAG